MSAEEWFVIDENPVGWAVGPLSVGRRNGKLVPMIGRNQELSSFQEGVKETIIHKYPAFEMFVDTDVEVRIFVWKRLEEYRSASGRVTRDKKADATNIQKAVEDSIQALLIDNDVHVRRITTEVVRQDTSTNGCIIIAIKPYEGFDPDQIPTHIWFEAEETVGGRDDAYDS